MARRAHHSREELHGMIVDAAQMIIESKGPQALSTRAIANQIGYTPGTLYQHFDNIQHITMHVNSRTMQRLMEELLAVPVSDGHATLHAYADVYVDYISSNQNAWNAMFHHPRKKADPIPDWYREQIDRLMALVTACLADVAPEQPASTTNEVAELLWASVHSVCSLENEGRLELILHRKLKPAVHRLVDIHVTSLTALT